MKIKGHDGKGNAVEFTAEEKITVMLKDQVPSKAPEGEMWWVKEGSVELNGSVSIFPTDKQMKYASNSYKAEGKVVICRMRTGTDQYLSQINRKFDISIEDTIDGNNMPDMVATSLVLN